MVVRPATLSTSMSRPGWISEPHHGQLVSCAGDAMPARLRSLSRIASMAWCDASVAPAVEVLDDALQTPNAHREGGDAEVGLGLATAGGEPEQIGEGLGGVSAIGMLRVRERWSRQQQEGEPERSP